jgi:hypothetical protein
MIPKLYAATGSAATLATTPLSSKRISLSTMPATGHTPRRPFVT